MRCLGCVGEEDDDVTEEEEDGVGGDAAGSRPKMASASRLSSRMCSCSMFIMMCFFFI